MATKTPLCTCGHPRGTHTLERWVVDGTVSYVPRPCMVCPCDFYVPQEA